MKVDPATLRPEAGDFAIGLDVLPYVNYLGNVFGKTYNNNLNLATDYALCGKYFLTNTTAIRVSLKTSMSTDKVYTYVTDDAQQVIDPTSTAEVTDLKTTKDNSIGLSVGYEMRKDRGRFTFLYGGQFYYGRSREQNDYTYGNPISEVNQIPSNSFLMGSERTLSEDYGVDNKFGLGGFVGLEYFVAKNISVGADFSLNFAYTNSSQSDYTQETWNGSEVYEFTTPTSPGNTGWSLETSSYGDLYGGQIYLSLYF